MRSHVSVLLAVALVSGLLAGSSADAAKKKVRRASSIYDSPAIGSGDATGVCSGSSGCATFAIGAKEAFIDLKIEDANGLPVYATVGQDTDPSNNFTEVVGRFCGETEEPMAITPGITVTIWLWALPGARPPCPGFATNGTVHARISNLP